MAVNESERPSTSSSLYFPLSSPQLSAVSSASTVSYSLWPKVQSRRDINLASPQSGTVEPGPQNRTSTSADCNVCALPTYRADSGSDPLHDNHVPGTQALVAAEALYVYDEDGASVPFQAITRPLQNAQTRQLVIFIRHFFCGACQAYITALKTLIDPLECSKASLQITIIGCGEPHMIAHYRTFVHGCPWPIYADPTRQLYRALGMRRTMKIGKCPDYMRNTNVLQWMSGQTRTISKSMLDPHGMRKRDILSGGSQFQVGGEFLFIDGELRWCHHMKTFRDHTEVVQLLQLLKETPDYQVRSLP